MTFVFGFVMQVTKKVFFFDRLQIKAINKQIGLMCRQSLLVESLLTNAIRYSRHFSSKNGDFAKRYL